MSEQAHFHVPWGSPVSYQEGGSVPAICAQIQGLQAALLASHHKDIASLRQSVSLLTAENQRLRAALGLERPSPSSALAEVITPAAAASGLSAPSPPAAAGTLPLPLIAEAELAAAATKDTPAAKRTLCESAAATPTANDDDTVSMDAVVLQERVPVEQQMPGELPSLGVAEGILPTSLPLPKRLDSGLSADEVCSTPEVREEPIPEGSMMTKGESSEDLAVRRKTLRATTRKSMAGGSLLRSIQSEELEDGCDSSDVFGMDAVSRLRVKNRLGLADAEVSIVTPSVLLHAIRSLGICKYDESDCILVIRAMDRCLHKERWNRDKGRQKTFIMEGTQGAQARASICAHAIQVSANQSKALQGGVVRKNRFTEMFAAGRRLRKRSSDSVSSPHDVSSSSRLWGAEPEEQKGVSFNDFLRFLCAEDNKIRLGPEAAERIVLFKEVLLTGEVNRLVAELANVRVDDLASPPPSMDLLTALEPVVSIIIVINALVLGLESDPALEVWSGWGIFEWVFISAFLLELAIRVSVSGPKLHFCGADCAWSWFDLSVLVFAVLEQMSKFQGSSAIFRLLRITRLTRLVRMLRFDCLKELTLMMKGLVAGLRTLGWALVLLFAAIYVIAIGMTETLGKSAEFMNSFADGREYFSTVPRSMFFVFRCFTNDCGDSEGRPMVDFLEKKYGWAFIIPYVCSVMLITFGIFNLIIAIYIESTMTAAKHEQEVDKKRRMNESLRIARATKKLLKKFCKAITVFNEPLSTAESFNVSQEYIERALIGDVVAEVEDSQMTVSKELFLMVIQDREVQAMMDELDIPADRAHLFDVLDADSSGGLEVAELVQGLLNVRGETRKSDLVACLLGVRALQDMIRQVAMELRHEIRQVEKLIKKNGGERAGSSGSSESLISDCRASIRPPSQLDGHRWKC